MGKKNCLLGTAVMAITNPHQGRTKFFSQACMKTCTYVVSGYSMTKTKYVIFFIVLCDIFFFNSRSYFLSLQKKACKKMLSVISPIPNALQLTFSFGLSNTRPLLTVWRPYRMCNRFAQTPCACQRYHTTLIVVHPLLLSVKWSSKEMAIRKKKSKGLVNQVLKHAQHEVRFTDIRAVSCCADTAEILMDFTAEHFALNDTTLIFVLAFLALHNLSVRKLPNFPSSASGPCWEKLLKCKKLSTL